MANRKDAEGKYRKNFTACQMLVSDVYDFIITPRHFHLPLPTPFKISFDLSSPVLSFTFSFFINKKVFRSRDDLLIFHDNTGKAEKFLACLRWETIMKRNDSKPGEFVGQKQSFLPLK
jgi:hypothetical protein